MTAAIRSPTAGAIRAKGMSDLPIHYAPAGKMLWILGVLALGMTAIGVGIMIVGGLVGWLTGGPAALFFGACTVVIFYRAVAEAPVLSLTEDGVKPWRYPFLRWEEIEFAEAAMSNEQLFLVIHAKDHDAYLARFGFFKRKWAQLSQSLMQGSVYQTKDMFVVPVADVARTHQCVSGAQTRRAHA